jgi:D-erythronate 2-dehydrogenase
MRVLVTGADGFIGRALVHALRVGHDVIATDRGDGDIADAAHLDRLFAKGPFDRVFHLAAIVSGAAEADFDAGRRVNLDATIGVLDRCRAQARRGGSVARVVQASSIAVFGTPLPTRIDDATEPKPSLSYGTHKRVAELLIDDATRRGEIDGRALRLPGVVVRPALPNGALSAFNSDVIREPLAGRDYECPVGAEATIWLTSRRAAVANLLHLAQVDGAALGAQRALTAPALAISIGAIVAALGRFDAAAPARIRYARRPNIEAQFGRWPLDCSFARAESLGLVGEASIDALIRDHLESTA